MRFFNVVSKLHGSHFITEGTDDGRYERCVEELFITSPAFPQTQRFVVFHAVIDGVQHT